MQKDSPPHRAFDTLLGVLSLVFWSTSIAIGRRLTERVGVFTTPATAFLLSGIISCLFWSIRLGTPKALLRYRAAYLWGCGGLFCLYIVSMYGAIGSASSRQQVLEVGLINYLWPALILVFSVPILGHRVRPTLWPGIVLALAGASLAVAQRGGLSWAGWQRNVSTHPWPYLLAFVAAISWALYSTISRRVGPGRGVGAVPLFVLVTGILLTLARWSAHEQSQWTPEAWGLLAYMAIFPITLAYAFWEYAVRKGNVVLLAALSYLTPVLSTGISAAVLGVVPGAGLWVAGALVVGGALVCRYSVEES